jgi:hypothetical protein
MLDAARKLEFERAASLRDRIDEIRATLAMAEMGAGAGRTGGAGRSGGRAPKRIKRRFGPDR